jgi:hypothetical protein
MKKYRLLLLYVSTSLFAANSASGNSVFTLDDMPTQYQLYARNSNDSSRVIYAGSTAILNIDSVFLKTYKNDVLIEVQSRKLFYSEGSATFNLAVNIHAELSKYSFQLLYQKQGQMFIDHEVTDIVCGDVLIIHRQSNAEATRSWAGNISISNDYVVSLGQMDSGNSSSWAIAHANSKGIGGIGAWGMVLCDKLVKQYQVPLAVFNGAKGGKPISYFLPGSANYKHLKLRLQVAGLADKVRAIYWYQGESDCRNDQYMTYAKNWKILYDRWKVDYPNFEKIYFMQIRPMGSAGSWPQQLEVREAQRTIKANYNIGEITYLATAGIDGSIGTEANFGGSGGYDEGGQHYDWHGYQHLGQLLFPLAARDLFEETWYGDSVLYSAMILNAEYSNADNTEITLSFDQNLVWDSEPLHILGNNFYLKDHIYLDNSYGNIESGHAESNRIILSLSAASTASKITYTPDWLYNGMPASNAFLYKGPWIKGSNGTGIMTFQNVSIGGYVTEAGTTEKKKNEFISIYPNPASGTVHIHGLNENSTINLINLAGTQFRIFYLHSGNQRIELAGLEPGIYLLVFENLAIHKKIMIL